ncbi:hypothetical protein GOP47_0016510, partial [Adiantum capillus-veneris]
AGLADNIVVSTSVAADVLGASYPPSAGSFRADITDTIMKPLLEFLSNTSSPFHLNIYPYLTWSFNSKQIPLPYALFQSNTRSQVEDGDLTYTNLLDAQLDAVWAAIAKLGFPNISLVITETGWPTAGGVGATPELATSYMEALVQKTLTSQGTPSHPGTPIPTYIFALFNENHKGGAPTEKNWGLLYPNGTRVYDVSLTDSAAVPARAKQWCVPAATSNDTSLQQALDFICSSNAAYCSAIQDPQKPCFLPNTLISHASFAMNAYWQANKANGSTCDFRGIGQITITDPSYGSCTYNSNVSESIPPSISPPPPSAPTSPPLTPTPTSDNQWCIAKEMSDNKSLQESLDYVCNFDAKFCSLIQNGQPCFEPNTLNAHASFAMNSYWQANKANGGNCDFGGIGQVTYTNP